MTHIFLAMQAAIERTEARKYGHKTVAEIEAKAANIRGIGYPISGDALAIEYQKERALYALQTIGDAQDAQGAKP